MKTLPIIVLTTLSILSTQSIAGSVAGNGGATEVTQILNLGEGVMQTVAQIQQVQHGIQQVNQMLRDAQRLGSNPLGLDDMVGVYNNVVGEVKAMQNLAYGTANAAEHFKLNHPDFDPKRKYDPANYVRRSNTTMRTIQSAIQSGASTVARAENEQARIQALGRAVNSADGTTQMLQTANAVQYEVLQQLRATQVYQKTVNDAQMSFIASKTSDKDEQVARNTKYFGDVTDIPPPSPRRYK